MLVVQTSSGGTNHFVLLDSYVVLSQIAQNAISNYVVSQSFVLMQNAASVDFWNKSSAISNSGLQLE